MMERSEIVRLLKQAIPDAEVQADDLTGGGDHFKIVVVSPIFRGKTLIDQHRLVQQPLQSALDDGRIHAIQIKTSAPKDSAKTNTGEDSFRVIQ